MAAFGTKVVVLMMVLPSLLLLQTSSVEAVDILVYNEDGCSGTVALGCYDIPANTCCTINGAPAIQIAKLLNGQSANIYTGGGCKTEITHLDGPNAGECYFNDAFSGAFWYYNTPSDELQASDVPRVQLQFVGYSCIVQEENRNMVAVLEVDRNEEFAPVKNGVGPGISDTRNRFTSSSHADASGQDGENHSSLLRAYICGK